MSFASPAWLLLLPLVGLLLWLDFRFGERAAAALGVSSLEGISALDDRLVRAWRRARPFIRAAGLTLLVLAMARPRQGVRADERDILATDIMLCLDVSDSMRAEDFAPRNRITVAKQAAKEFIEKRDRDRIGLVLFAAVAMTECPLTTDYSSLMGLLDAVDVGEIPQNRTAIGDGIVTATARLGQTQAKSKVIILLTDGANNAGATDPVTAARTAQGLGIRIYAIGAGTPGGGMLTVNDPVFGARRVKVADSLDEETLEKIATPTGGKYFRATNSRALYEIFGEIDRLEKTSLRVKEYSDFIERFEWFLIPGLLLLGLELAVGRLLLAGAP
jgi:Ca-activated chloride channel family protein